MKKLDKWDYENLFYQTSDKSRLRKIIDHYEIYKKVSNVKGDIFEFGVFKGVSLIRFLTFRDIINKKTTKHVYGFDAFGKFPHPKNDNKHQQHCYHHQHRPPHNLDFQYLRPRSIAI